MLTDADMTPQQRRVYPLWKAGTRSRDAYKILEMSHSGVKAVYAELTHLEANGGRRTHAEQMARAKEIGQDLARGEECGECGLRGKHICTKDSIYEAAAARRAVQW